MSNTRREEIIYKIYAKLLEANNEELFNEIYELINKLEKTYIDTMKKTVSDISSELTKITDSNVV